MILAQLPLLTSLDLGDMMLGYTAVFDLIQNLPPTLVSLQLTGNNLQKFELQMIVNILGVPMRSFEQLTKQNWPPIKRDIYIEVNREEGTTNIQGKTGPTVIRRQHTHSSYSGQAPKRAMLDVVNSIAAKQHLQERQDHKAEDGIGFGLTQPV